MSTQMKRTLYYYGLEHQSEGPSSYKEHNSASYFSMEVL